MSTHSPVEFIMCTANATQLYESNILTVWCKVMIVKIYQYVMILTEVMHAVKRGKTPLMNVVEFRKPPVNICHAALNIYLHL